MAFNLNKNEGGDNEGSSKKTSTSKFNLSKQDESVGPASVSARKENSGGSKIWIILLALLLLVGGGAWYFLSNKPNDTVASDQATAPNTDTTKNTTAAALPTNSTNKQEAVASTTSSGSSTPALNDVSDKSNAPVTANNGQPSNATSVSDKKVGATSTEKKSASPATSTTSGSSGGSANLNNKVPASFGKGSTDLSNIDQSIIGDLINSLKTNANSTVTVNGYASSEGDLSVNQQISQARANTFKQYLISKGVLAKKINAVGRGVENPIASNDTEEGRRKNRRVEIVLQ